MEVSEELGSDRAEKDQNSTNARANRSPSSPPSYDKSSTPRDSRRYFVRGNEELEGCWMKIVGGERQRSLEGDEEKGEGRREESTLSSLLFGDAAAISGKIWDKNRSSSTAPSEYQYE